MSHSYKRLRKFRRDPNYTTRLGRRRITRTSLDIITTIERYRVIPTSLLLRLVGGDQRNVYSQLQQLYHKGLVNRFCLFGPTGRPQEFNYFLDNSKALDLLIDQTAADADSLDFELVRRNREKWTPILESEQSPGDGGRDNNSSPSWAEGSEGQKFFLRHELMISRFHGMLELATRASAGDVKLIAWFQGPILHHSVEAPKLVYREDTWRQQDDIETIPHRPDAFFTLQKKDSPEPLHFFYEADRKTTNTKRMIKKLRGHFHYIAKAKHHRNDYGIQRIRAVLTETLDIKWAETLRVAAQHPAVSGPKPSELFWFTASELFANRIQKEVGTTVKRVRHVPYYLENPQVIFKEIWFTPLDRAGDTPKSLLY
jgi:hypothetical protein